MKMTCLLVVSLPLWTMFLLSVSADDAPKEPLFSAMFVFGDSLVDNGNNNRLQSVANANYLPHGIDFPGDQSIPTGRFSNGKTIIDFLGEMLGLPYLPAFADIIEQHIDISRGVNFASASAGILEETRWSLGEHVSFSHQVSNLESTLNQMKTPMDDEKLSQYLENSLTVVIIGSNDYLNNYLLPELYDTSVIYNPSKYADILIELYKKHILALHSLGLRKFLLAAVGPLGCIPNQPSQSNPPGQCRAYVNDMVVAFNTLLKSLVDELNKEYMDSIFVYGDTYTVFNDMIANPKSYGFGVSDKACCGIGGMNKGWLNCLPMFDPCPNRDDYVFWDAFHPSQAVNKIMASKAFNGPPSDCYPINVLQMAQKHLPHGQNNV